MGPPAAAPRPQPWQGYPLCFAGCLGRTAPQLAKIFPRGNLLHLSGALLSSAHTAELSSQLMLTLGNIVTHKFFTMSTFITKVINNPRSSSYVILSHISAKGSIVLSKTKAKSLGLYVNKIYIIDAWPKVLASGKTMHIIKVQGCLSTQQKRATKSKKS